VIIITLMNSRALPVIWVNQVSLSRKDSFLGGMGMPTGKAINDWYCLVTRNAVFEERYIMFFGPYHVIGIGPKSGVI
jgi:hypothetical protein